MRSFDFGPTHIYEFDNGSSENRVRSIKDDFKLSYQLFFLSWA